MPGKGSRGGKSEKPKDTKGTCFQIMCYLADFKWFVIGLCLLAILSNIGNLLGPAFAGQAISHIGNDIGTVNFSAVYHDAELMLIVYIGSNLLSFVVNIGMINIARQISEKMRNDVFSKLTHLPVGYFDQHATGDIISRISYDIDVINTSLSTDVVQIITSFFTITGSFFMMLMISPPLTCCVSIAIPISILYTNRMRRKTKPLYAKRSSSYGEMNGFVEEMFSGHKTIQAYAYENQVCEQFDAINQASADAYYHADSLGLSMGPTIGFINNLSMSLIGMVGAFYYFKGLIGLGGISSFVLYSRKFSSPINEIANIINELYSALAAAERVFALLNETEEVCDSDNAMVLNNVSGEIQFENVTFGYQPDKMIIHDLNMEVLAGKTVAIVGPTGAGKTTIVNLLMRFYDVNSGSITLDKTDVKAFIRKSLRHAYAMVLQNTWLFQGTIFENIAYGKENATKEEVIQAAKNAHIHSFIMSLPNGYETTIHDDGDSISKGQKQLLTIARAMLLDSKLLILDEATSNVDTNTEQLIQNAMLSLMKNKTCFVIAHRLSTIQKADLIIVIDKGDIIEKGTHKQLLSRRGFYYNMYVSQFD